MSRKPGRNEPCPCGSGKKYKRCCLASDEAAARELAEQEAEVDDVEEGIDGEDGDDYRDSEDFLDEEESSFGVDEITGICYTRGEVTTFAELRSGHGVQVTEWQAPDIPRQVLDSIDEEEVLNLADRWGDEKIGEPMQVDIIDFESEEHVVTVEVFNRGIALAWGGNDQLRRIHRVCRVLERAARGEIEPSAETSPALPDEGASESDEASERAQALDRAALLRRHRHQRGTCALCGAEFTRREAKEHLAVCARQHGSEEGVAERLLHIRVTAPGLPAYWLDVQTKASARLDALDAFLRETWVECCGHLSVFEIGDVLYYSQGTELGEMRESFDPSGQEVRDMTATLEEALPAVGVPFRYEYDFGSTTPLTLSVVDERTGAPGQEPVQLLARNTPPVWPCAACGEPAEFVCTFCLIEGADAFVCAAHETGHVCDEAEGLMPVVNSPRMGVCGYTGD